MNLTGELLVSDVIGTGFEVEFSATTVFLRVIATVIW
jgi:hypothetical protein